MIRPQGAVPAFLVVTTAPTFPSPGSEVAHRSPLPAATGSKPLSERATGGRASRAPVPLALVEGVSGEQDARPPGGRAGHLGTALTEFVELWNSHSDEHLVG